MLPASFLPAKGQIMTDQKIAGFVANLGRKPSLLNFDPAQGLTISIELEGAEPVDVDIRTLQEKELVDFIISSGCSIVAYLFRDARRSSAAS